MPATKWTRPDLSIKRDQHCNGIFAVAGMTLVYDEIIEITAIGYMLTIY